MTQVPINYDVAHATTSALWAIDQATRTLRRAIASRQRFTVDVEATTIEGADGEPVPNGGYDIHIRVEPPA